MHTSAKDGPTSPTTFSANATKLSLIPRVVATAPIVKKAAIKKPIPQSTFFNVSTVATLIPGNSARTANKMNP